MAETINKGGGGEFEIVDPSQFETFIAYIRSVNSVSDFLRIAKKIMPEIKFDTAKSSQEIQREFQSAFAASDNDTRKKIIAELHRILIEDYDSR